jgi:glycosyltransferase involved in cell wall biosynthesis
VVTIHDLAFAHSPELCRPETREYDELLRRAIARGATVHTVSNHVAVEVREHFALPEERVVPIYYGIDVAAGSGDAARGRALARHDRYVLAISTVEPRKNYPRLVRAFTAVASHDPDLGLVVAGGRGWGAGALDDAVSRSPASARIARLGYVSDRDRADLLAGATVLAYPSLYEGFGHPPFEAMAAGLPVVTSRAGALPETVGDAAVLVDPLDEDELADALERVTSDGALRARLTAAGHARLGAFPWDRSIEELAALYRRVADRP